MGAVKDNRDCGTQECAGKQRCTTGTGQQIRSYSGSFQNANFLISQPNLMMLHSLESSWKDDFNEGHIIEFG